MPVCSWFLVWILVRFQALLRPGGLWVRGDSGDTGVQHSAECQLFCYRLPYDLSWHQFRPCCAVEPITSTAVILSLLPQWFHHSFTNFEYNITPPLKDAPQPPLQSFYFVLNGSQQPALEPINTGQILEYFRRAQSKCVHVWNISSDAHLMINETQQQRYGFVPVRH